MAKRYWIKLSQHFFDSDEITYLESIDNGDKYINIWLKLLLKCIKEDSDKAGFLRFNEKIPYNDKLLSSVLRVDIDNLRSAMAIFKELGLLTLLDDGTIYIEEIQRLIGSESDSAERVRKHRLRAEKQNLLPSNTDVTICNDNKEEEEEEEEEKKNKRKKKESVSLSFLDFGEFSDLMQEFVEYRQRIKKPVFTQKGLNRVYNKLVAYSGGDLGKADFIIGKTTNSGKWLDIFPIKLNEYIEPPQPEKELTAEEFEEKMKRAF